MLSQTSQWNIVYVKLLEKIKDNKNRISVLEEKKELITLFIVHLQGHPPLAK